MQSSQTHLTAIVLAAGQSHRMGPSDKLLLPFVDSTIIETVIRTIQTVIPHMIVVCGENQEQLSRLLIEYDIELIHNSNSREGIASSIRAGVRAASKNVDGWLICLGDMPRIQPETLRKLTAEFYKNPGKIIIPCHDEKRGNPVLFDQRFRENLLALHGDLGGRQIILKHPESVVEVEVDDPGIWLDVDTKADYEELSCRSE